jgi:hypothetical protein
MAEEHRARRQGAFLATAHGGSCNAGHPLLPPAAVDCSSRSDGPLSATVCCHRVRSTIGVFLGIEPPGGRCRKLCAGACIAFCARSPSRPARCRRIMCGFGGSRRAPRIGLGDIIRAARLKSLQNLQQLKSCPYCRPYSARGNRGLMWAAIGAAASRRPAGRICVPQ